MAVGRIKNLDINFKAGRSGHDAGELRRLVPLELRARADLKAPLTTGMFDDAFRDVHWFVAFRIVFGKKPDVSRGTDAGVDAGRP